MMNLATIRVVEGGKEREENEREMKEGGILEVGNAFGFSGHAYTDLTIEIPTDTARERAILMLLMNTPEMWTDRVLPAL
jgi:hypothetical protein